MSRYAPISHLKRNTIVALRRGGKTYSECAQATNTSPRTVQRVLSDAGLVKHYPDIFLHGNIKHAVATALYQGVGVCTLARKYGVDPDTITRIASLNDISLFSDTRYKSERQDSLLHNNYHKSKSKRRLVVESRHWKDTGVRKKKLPALILRAMKKA